MYLDKGCIYWYVIILLFLRTGDQRLLTEEGGISIEGQLEVEETFLSSGEQGSSSILEEKGVTSKNNIMMEDEER